MRYFSAESSHGTADRAGFWDDTRVLAWSSRAARDAYVLARRETNISVRAIPEDKVTTWATAAIWATTAVRVSHNSWMIKRDDNDFGPDYLGEVFVGNDDDVRHGAVRLFA